jgi:hypothetical protein
MGLLYSLRVITKLYLSQSIATPYALMGMKDVTSSKDFKGGA